MGVRPSVVVGGEFGVADLAELEAGNGIDRLFECSAKARIGMPRVFLRARRVATSVVGSGWVRAWWASRAAYLLRQRMMSRLDRPSAVLRAM